MAGVVGVIETKSSRMIDHPTEPHGDLTEVYVCCKVIMAIDMACVIQQEVIRGR